MKHTKHQKGFSIIAAVFLMVIVAMIVAAMSTISIHSHSQLALNVQGIKAYYAARSGLDYEIGRVLASSANCATDNGTTETIDSYNITITCNSTSFMDGSTTSYNMFRIGITATSGSMSNNTFVSRSIEADITDLP